MTRANYKVEKVIWVAAVNCLSKSRKTGLRNLMDDLLLLLSSQRHRFPRVWTTSSKSTKYANLGFRIVNLLESLRKTGPKSILLLRKSLPIHSFLSFCIFPSLSFLVLLRYTKVRLGPRLLILSDNRVAIVRK